MRALSVVYLTVFLDLLGFGIILPQLPFYAIQFGASGAWVGVLLAAFSVAQLFGAVLLGRLSDRYGRRPVMLMSLLGSALAFTGAGLAQSLWQLIASRALAGLFGGSIATAQAYVADVTEPKDRAKYMGLIGASIGMGFVLGPFIGAEMSRFGFSAASFLAAGLSLFDLVLALFFLKEPPAPRPAADAEQAGSADGLPRRRQRVSLRYALSQPVIGRLLAASFVTSFAFVGMEATFALLGKQRFDLGPATMGRFFALIGIVLAVVQGGVVGRLVARLGERRVALIGSLVLSLSLLAIPWSPKLVCLGGVMLIMATGQGLLLPSTSTLISRCTPASMQGGILGVNQSLSAGARAVGPVLAGALFDVDFHLPYVASAALVLGVAASIATLRETAQST
jgi:DHA1 family tetracycline resistance protein-like MFS transporter